MLPFLPIKMALKRGALIAAANWPVTIIQAIADALFKLLVAAPIIGGVLLAVLIVGAEPVALLSLDWRELVTTIISSLVSRPAVLAGFMSSLALVVAGGSLFVFLVKGGTVSVLVRGEARATHTGHTAVHLESLGDAAAFSIETFITGARTLFPRYARLGVGLMAMYLLIGMLYLGAIMAVRGTGWDWSLAALCTLAFVAIVTFVNLLYLLMQIVMAADDCGVMPAARRVTAFVRRDTRRLLTVFLIVLAMVVLATGASVIVWAALAPIAFIPIVGLAALPLQLLAWALRGLVFQFISLTSVGAYLDLYRVRPGPASIA